MKFESNLSQYFVDKNSQTSLHIQVEEIISNLLNSKPYSQGEKLPNELDISTLLCVSRNTVRKAMDSLIQKNLIIRKKNRGTFKNIDNEKIKTTLNNWYSFNDEMKKQNRDFKIFSHEVVMSEPMSEVSEKLGIPSNRKVIRLLRAKGYLEPELYFESYLHPDLDISIEELQSNEIIQLYTFLENKLHVKIVHSQEEISATLPTVKMKKHLKINDDTTPIIVRKMLIFDENKNKIAYSIGCYLSNKFTFNLEISR